MLKSACILLALTGLAASPALAQSNDGVADSREASRRAGKPDMAPNIPAYSLDSQDFMFPSGLRVIMQPDHSEPMVAITTVFDDGSSSDPAGKEGIAHFVEHLWFKSRHGTLPRTWDVLSEMGCQLNASTSDDWTNYMSICPASNAPALLKLASLRMTAPVEKVVEAEVESEREVIRNELRMRMENGGGEARRYINDAVYPPDHPYHNLGIGTHGSLDNITLADIVQFTKDHYRAENATIVMVGDFDPDEAASMIFANMDPSLLHPAWAGEDGAEKAAEDIVRYARPGVDNPQEDNPGDWLFTAQDPENPGQPFPFGQTPRVRIDQVGMEPLPAYRTEIGVYDAPVDDRLVVIGWSAPGAYRGQDLIARITSNVASNIMAGELESDPRVLKDDNGNAELGCFALPSKQNTTVMCFIGITKRADGEQVAQRALDQLAILWNPDLRPMLDRSFSMSKAYLLSNTLLSLDVFAGIGEGARATDIAHHAHFTGSPQFHSDVMNEVNTLTAEQVAEYAYTWLRRDRAAISVLNPIPDEDRLLDNSESDYHGATRGDDLVVSALNAESVTPDAIRREITLPALDTIKETTLANGLRVVVMPHGEAPLVQTQLIVRGGYATDDGRMYLDDNFTRDPQNEPELDPLQFAGSWADGNNGSIDRYNTFGVRAPSGNLDSSLWLLRQRIDGFDFKLRKKGKWIKKRRKNLMSAWKRSTYWQDEVVNEHLGADHPAFHTTTWDDIERWDNVDKDAAQAFHDQRWQPSNATLLIVGNIDPDEAIDMANAYWSNWTAPEGTPAAELQAPPVASINETGRRVVLFDVEKKTQTQVDSVCRLSEVDTLDRPVIGLASSMLSDHLFEELRARAGVTYGAYAYNRTYPGGTATFNMSSLTQNSGVPLAINTFIQVADDAAAGEFPTERLRSTQLNQARTYVVGQQSIGQMSNRLGFALGDGSGWDYFTTMPDKIANADIASMSAPFAPCPGTQLITLAGPAEVLEPMLQEAGIEYELFDHEQRALSLLEQYSPKDAEKYREALAEKAEAEAEAEAEKAGTDE